MRRACTLLLGTLAATSFLGATAAPGYAAIALQPGASGFDVAASEAGGGAAELAGSHPYSLDVRIGFASGEPRQLRVELPGGLIENPTAAPVCTQADFHTSRSSPHETSASGESCPDTTQVGVVRIEGSLGTRSFGLFNLAPAPGHPSRFGAAPYGAPLLFTSELRQAQGEYGATLVANDLTQHFEIDAIELEFWGVPWADGHSGQRGNCLNEAQPELPHGQCKVDLDKQSIPPRAYLTLPSQCASSLAFELEARGWGEVGPPVSATSQLPALEDCDDLPFFALAAVTPSTQVASSPSGILFTLQGDQTGLLTPGQRLSPRIARVRIALAEGLTINPSLGSGLAACSEAQFDAESASSAPGQGCPNPAKVGTLTLETPLLAEDLSGSIYLAEPYRNPFGSPLALYLVARAPERGVIVKVAGELQADPATGQLVAIFGKLPQLPYSNLRAEFQQHQRALLASPERCGRYTSQIELAPWTDLGATVLRTSIYDVIAGLAPGGACPSGPLPFAPKATAGALNGSAGSPTPFYIHLTRNDVEQEIVSYSAMLPEGMTGALAGIPLCSDAAIETAKGRSGRAEEANPSCPAAAQIGHTFTGYGIGLAPAYASGKMYLAGPYRGSALSVVAINAAAVGPFDLGTIVIRSALRVDPHTAQLSIDSAASDSIPHILGGIPLRLRDIRVHIDRRGFAINPTSCEAATVTSLIAGSGARFSDPTDDTLVAATNPFAVSNCSALGFSPHLGLRLLGKTRRGGHPSLRATYTPRPGDANLERVQMALPGSAFLAQDHIREVCTRERFAAERCPAASIYGRAVAHTPLLDGALAGPVYLRSSDNPLPDLVVDLRQGAIRVILVGRIDSVGRGRIRATFERLPDAPVTRFALTMAGGRRGLLVNSVGLCSGSYRASATLLAQNNKGRLLSPRLRAKCPQRRAKGKDGQKGKGRPSR